ncbi:polar amino acid ABC transporter permease [Mycolicibacterium arabiense]|uniref:Polar amino acid ABC transporter permease n=1 Tax=Mycolicibacterium arabiense TaxID=1286181 RepID=A0A7I7RX51_9MYCO|nr:amino acid ABC transporter permease [Mycolicibacterium arabiense]MCV7373882.1 amino acid ABC transporter permease [Mycolicibacterium arabiense]BBY49127.1 polar amino acid ABC transporter permease [Mycolicibacterium arabiense]
MQFDWAFFWKSLFAPSESFVDGLILTIVVSAVAMVLATLVGLAVALMRRSRFAVVRWCAGCYIWVIRGTPLLVQLVIIYTGLAAIGLYQFHDASILGLSVKAAVQAAIIGLMINESAYIAEIIRAGLDSVPKGQFEAAASLGMTPTRLMRYIIVPQSLRVMVPPMGNSFNGMMKTTSVLSVIGVSEMFLVTQQISSATFHTFEIFIVAAIYYLALTTVWTFIQAGIENRLTRQLGIEVRVPITARLLGARRAGPAAATNATLQPHG